MVWTEGEVGASRDGGFSGAGGPDNETTDGDEGLRGGMCDVGEVRTEAKAAAAALTKDGLRGTAGSSGRFDVGLVRPEARLLTGSSLEAEVDAGALTLGLLVFRRVNLPPRLRWVCS